MSLAGAVTCFRHQKHDGSAEAARGVTCEVDGSNGIDVVMYIGGMRPSFSAILPGKLRARPLQAYSQTIPSKYRTISILCHGISIVLSNRSLWRIGRRKTHRAAMRWPILVQYCMAPHLHIHPPHGSCCFGCSSCSLLHVTCTACV